MIQKDEMAWVKNHQSYMLTIEMGQMYCLYQSVDLWDCLH